MSEESEEFEPTSLSTMFNTETGDFSEPTPTEDAEEKEVKVDDEEETKIPDETDWEKRFKDSQRYIQEVAEDNKKLADTNKELSERLNKVETLSDKVVDVTKRLGEEVFEEGEELDLSLPAPEEPKAPSSFETKVTLSEKMVRSVYSDYEDVVGKAGEKEAPFMKALESTPSLWNRVTASDNPALECYNIGKNFLYEQKYGSTLEQQRETIAKEEREKIEKELKLKVKKPTSNVTTLREAGTSDGISETEAPIHTPLSKMFKA